MSLAAGFKASTNARAHIFKQVSPSLKEAAAFSCSKFVFFLPHAFFCLKMLVFTPLHSASSLLFFHLQFFIASKPFERASRFFTVLNPSIFWIFQRQKVDALPFSSSLSQELLEVLMFAKSGKIDCYSKNLFSNLFASVPKSKSLKFCKACMIIAKIRFKK